MYPKCEKKVPELQDFIQRGGASTKCKDSCWDDISKTPNQARRNCNLHGKAYISADKFFDRRYTNNSGSTIFRQRSSSYEGYQDVAACEMKRLPSGHGGRLLMLVEHTTDRIVQWILQSSRMLLALKAWCTGMEQQEHSSLGHKWSRVVGFLADLKI